MSLSTPVSHRRPRSHSRYRRALRHLESLEARTLMSVTTSVYTVPGLQTDFAAYDSAGHLWVVNQNNPAGLSFDQIDAVSHSVTATIDISALSPGSQPVRGVGVNANHLYMADNNGGLDDINLTDLSAQFVPLGADYGHSPAVLSVAPDTGAVWFVGGIFGGNYIGRWMPGDADAQYTQIPDEVEGTVAFTIAANPGDSAWVGMSITNPDPIDFHFESVSKQLALTTYSAGSFSNSTYAFAINSGHPADDVLADTNNYLSNIVSDGSGGVWLSLSATITNQPHAQFQAPDTIVHATLGPGNVLLQPAWQITDGATGVTGSPTDHPGFVGNLALDSSGRLWFSETEGNNLGYFDTATSTFSYTAYPSALLHNINTTGGTDTHFLETVTLNPVAPELTFVNTADVFNGEDTQFLTVKVETSTPPPVFSGTGFNVTAAENVALTGLHVANFTAPTPTGSYVATITWGDGSTTSNVPVTVIDATHFSVSVNKTFAAQSTAAGFGGTVTIKDTAAPSVTVGTIGFTSVISDTPTTITSYSVNNIFGRIALPTVVFTDDIDSTASWFTVTFNWGDSSSSNAAVVKDVTTPGRYLAVGLHNFNRRGTYAVTVTITVHDELGLVTTKSSTVSVTVR